MILSIAGRSRALVSSISLSMAGGAALRDEHAEANGTIRIQLADVTEASQVDRIVSEIVEAFGHIDVLVNSVGDIRCRRRLGSDLCSLIFASSFAKKINRLERAFAVLA